MPAERAPSRLARDFAAGAGGGAALLVAFAAGCVIASRVMDAIDKAEERMLQEQER